MSFDAWYDTLPTIDEVHIGLDAVLDRDFPEDWSAWTVGEAAFFYVIRGDGYGHACPMCDRDLVRHRGVPAPVDPADVDWSLACAEMMMLESMEVWP